MKKQVHPAVAVLIVLVVLGAVWFCYTRVFTGQMSGQVGTPASVAGKIPGAPPPPQPKGPGMMTGPNSPHPGVVKPAKHAGGAANAEKANKPK